MLIKMAQTPASYLIHNPRYNVDNQTAAMHEMKANVWTPCIYYPGNETLGRG